MDTRDEIRFLLNDQVVVTRDVGASDTVLDFLRLNRRLTGTKEGCAEGDCGACSVLVGRLRGGALVYEPINACIRFLATVDGCHVVTIEHVRGAGGNLHPVQQAMVDHHGSQCGFCTPGIVMALYALWMACPDPSEDQIETALQGNLCRCTGYQPIIDAARTAGGGQDSDPLHIERPRVAAQLAEMQDTRRVVIGPQQDRAILPGSLDDLAEVLVAAPAATIIAGATDVGLWVTKELRTISPAVFIGHLDALQQIHVDDAMIRIGAGVSYSQGEATLTEHYPHLGAFWRRIGGWQVRNMGTIGGNIANGSPIGDTPPILIALGAEIVLRHGSTRRTLPLEDFFLDYGKQDLRPGEFLEEIHVPRPDATMRHGAYKISKRRDEDISSVAVGFCVSVDSGRITRARIAFGGMAAIPKRARAAEAVLEGSSWHETAFLAAADQLDAEFTPMTDQRASAEYRMQVARNLFRRFVLEQGEPGEAVRLHSTGVAR